MNSHYPPFTRADIIGQNGNDGQHYDAVEVPKHYMLFENMEAIQAIEQLLTPQEYLGYLKGCELKYRLRAGKKEHITEDIHKALQYAKYREKHLD